jgi:hypothetical protein
MYMDWVRFAALDTPPQHSSNHRNFAAQDFAETGLGLSSG